jgi:nucleoside-diphosphate-sugar epimerase
MTPPQRTAAITGARGYLGGLVRRRLTESSWRTIALVRAPVPSDGDARRFDLAAPCDDGLLADVETLIHCAYDLTITGQADIERVNVEGTRRLLRAAVDAGTRRIIVLSSMSAYEGTTQIYGQAKLAIEAATLEVGGCVLRPGLVYGDHAGGMAAALRKLVRLPVVPVPAGLNRQFTVHEDDFTAVVAACAELPSMPVQAVGVAHPGTVDFRELLSTFASWDGRSCRFLPVPWKPMYWALRFGELLPVKLPFRADSLLGLVRAAPNVPGQRELKALGVPLRKLGDSPRRSS